MKHRQRDLAPGPVPHGSGATAPGLLNSDTTRTVILLIIALGVLGAILVYARPVLIPVFFALTIGVVASPVADKLETWAVPRVVVALSLLAIASVVLAFSFFLLEPLLTVMVTRLPEIRAEIEYWVQSASGLLRGIEDLSDEIERTIGSNGPNEEEAPDIPTVMDAIWLAPNLASSVLIFAGTLFFFVLTRSDLYGAAGRYKRNLFRAERAVARYFAAVTIINVGLGVATALVLSAIGLDNAMLWGLAAGVLNYVLYLGPLTIFGGLVIAGVMQFSGAMSFLPAAAFLMINLTEAQFVTPVFVGQRLRINPLAVFLAIVLGLWLWGPIGAIIALPVTLWLGVLFRPVGSRQPAVTRQPARRW